MDNLEYKEIVEVSKSNPSILELLKITENDPELIKIATDKLLELQSNRKS